MLGTWKLLSRTFLSRDSGSQVSKYQTHKAVSDGVPSDEQWLFFYPEDSIHTSENGETLIKTELKLFDDGIIRYECFLYMKTIMCHHLHFASTTLRYVLVENKSSN